MAIINYPYDISSTTPSVPIVNSPNVGSREVVVDWRKGTVR